MQTSKACVNWICKDWAESLIRLQPSIGDWIPEGGHWQKDDLEKLGVAKQLPANYKHTEVSSGTTRLEEMRRGARALKVSGCRPTIDASDLSSAAARLRLPPSPCSSHSKLSRSLSYFQRKRKPATGSAGWKCLRQSPRPLAPHSAIPGRHVAVVLKQSLRSQAERCPCRRVIGRQHVHLGRKGDSAIGQ